MDTQRSLVWLVTGCSSGFGASLALTALKAGHKVIATSRNPSEERKRQFEHLGGVWLALDVTSGPEKLQDVVSQAVAAYGRIDVLVNNAGIGIIGALEDTSPEEAQKMMDTNFLGPLNLIRAVIPAMRDQKCGTVVNISSAAALDAKPSMGLYGASKSALESMSQTLAKEVEPFGIRILIIQPGAFPTKFNHTENLTLTEKPMTESYRNTGVGEIVGHFSGVPVTSTPVNDLEKGCQAILEVVTGTKRGSGMEKYLRLPLSADAALRTRQQIARLQEGHDVFEDIWQSTGNDKYQRNGSS